METANMDNAKFFNLVKYHDWTWQRANGKEHQAGREKARQIQNLIQGETIRAGIDPLEQSIKKEMYDAWEAYSKDFENMPKPELSDFGL